VSGAVVLPFRRPASAPKRAPRPRGLAIVLSVTSSGLVLLADGVELELTPGQARELARDLREMADDFSAGVPRG
jgi:uncharacterized protein YjeT (DUF2065 family)